MKREKIIKTNKVIEFFKRLFKNKPIKVVDYSTLKFQPSQRVYVHYYAVYFGPIEVFKPGKSGTIISVKESEPYFLNEVTSKTIWWKVKFNCGTFVIPQGCITDLNKHLYREKSWRETPHVKK